MKRDWIEFARQLAEGARAKLAEDRRRIVAKRTLARVDSVPSTSSRR